MAPIPASAFPALRDRVVDALLGDDPARARELGLHEYDGRVADVSGAAIERRIARLRRDAAELAAVDSHSLSNDDALDLAELKSWVGTLPGPVARAAAREFAGLASFYRDDVATQVGGVGDAAMRERFARVNAALAARLEQFAARIDRAASDADTSHVLGRQRFAKLLLVRKGLTMSVDELWRRNEADLERNRRAFAPFAGQVHDGRIAEPDLLRVAEATMEETRRFAVDKSIVTIPFEEKIVVKPSPPFLQWSGAFFDGAGPFDTVRGSHYFITLPDPSLPPAERSARIVPLAQLHDTTIHEVYPGHFLQSLWLARAPTKIQKMYQSYSFTEGWAHYAEEMMVEQGYGAEVAAMKPAMLVAALARNCRVAASIGLHTRGETVEAAAQRLKKFHDALLAHGSAPIALIRDRVLADLDAGP